MNFTPIVHDVLPASVEPQVPPPIVKSAASPPLTEPLIEIVNGDLLVIVVLSVFDDDLETVP